MGILPAEPFTVYVSAASEDHARASAFIGRLKAAGVRVTYDWTPSVKAALDGKNWSRSDLVHFAIEDMDGASDADVFVALSPDDKSKGCAMWTELGFAMKEGAYTIISGKSRERNIFSMLVDVLFEHDEQAASFILSWHERLCSRPPTEAA